MERRGIVIGIVVGILGWGSVSARADSPDLCAHTPTELRCVEYVRNYDADTITFNIPGVHPLMGNRISVRVLGVDAPEIRGKTECEKKRAREAKAAVAAMLSKSKRVDLVNVGRDKYFRILADVQVDGISLREHLLKSGYAYPYDGGTKRAVNWCNPPDRGVAGKLPKR